VVLFALVFVSLMGISALVIDVVRMYDAHNNYRGYADAAALAGAQDLQQATRTVTPTEQTNARTAALLVLKSRLNATGVCPTNADIVKCPLVTAGGTQYLVDVRTPTGTTGASCVTPGCENQYSMQVTIDQPQFPVTIARLLGVSSWHVHVSSLAGLEFKPKYILEALRPSGNDGVRMLGTWLSSLYVDTGDLGTNSFATTQGFFGFPLDWYCIGALQGASCQPNGYRFDYANPPGAPPANISAAQSRHLPTLIADPLYPYPVYPANQGPANCTITATAWCFTASTQAIDVVQQTIKLAQPLASPPAPGLTVLQAHTGTCNLGSAGKVLTSVGNQFITVTQLTLTPGFCPFTATTTNNTPPGSDGKVLGKNASAITAQQGSTSCPTSIPGTTPQGAGFWTCFKPGVYATALSLCYPSCPGDNNANLSSGNNYFESGVYYFKNGFTLSGGNLIGGAGHLPGLPLAPVPTGVVLVVPATQNINITALPLNQVSLNWIAGCANAVDTTTCLPPPALDSSLPPNPMMVPAPQYFPLTIEVERNLACFQADGKTPKAGCATRNSLTIMAQTGSKTQFGGVIYAPTDDVTIDGSFLSLFFNPAQFVGQLVTWSTTYSSSFLSTIHIQYPTLREIGIVALDVACTVPPYGPTC
jgi:Flp pilus assembly protein TadG